MKIYGRVRAPHRTTSAARNAAPQMTRTVGDPGCDSSDKASSSADELVERCIKFCSDLRSVISDVSRRNDSVSSEYASQPVVIAFSQDQAHPVSSGSLLLLH